MPRRKVVVGATHQTRPSASYYYNTLLKPLGTRVRYAPRRGGKTITHELKLDKNGRPKWIRLGKLPKLQRKRSDSRRSTSRPRRRRLSGGGEYVPHKRKKSR